MSSFIKDITNPKTGKKQKAFYIDDYFGSHIYGVGFNKDGSDAKIRDGKSDKWEDICDFYKEEELNLK